jgi:hypothetical protein
VVKNLADRAIVAEQFYRQPTSDKNATGIIATNADANLARKTRRVG